MLWNVDSPVLDFRYSGSWRLSEIEHGQLQNPCDSLSCVKIRNWVTKKRAPTTSPPPPPHTFEPALLFKKKKTRNAASHCFQMGSPVQPIRVYVCETAPSLRSAALLPLLCPTRLVKFRVWRRRRGPTCSPCYTTPSGWRLWDGTPFTKNSFLKTSIRFLIY